MNLELTQGQVLAVENFIDKVTEENGICKQSVISLEESTGLTLITKDLDINRFTDVPTRSYCNDVVYKLKESLKTVKITDIVTPDDIISRVKKSNNSLAFIVNLFREISTIKPETIDRMLNEKYCAWYRDDALINLADDEPIFDVLNMQRDFIANVTGTCNTPNRTFNVIYDILLTHVSNPDAVSDNLPPLLGSLLDLDNFSRNYRHANLYCKKPLTLRDMCTLATNAGAIITILEELQVKTAPSQKESTSRFSDVSIYTYLTDKDTNEMAELDYHNLGILLSVLEDPQTITLLQVFAILAK